MRTRLLFCTQPRRGSVASPQPRGPPQEHRRAELAAFRPRESRATSIRTQKPSSPFSDHCENFPVANRVSRPRAPLLWAEKRRLRPLRSRKTPRRAIPDHVSRKMVGKRPSRLGLIWFGLTQPDSTRIDAHTFAIRAPRVLTCSTPHASNGAQNAKRGAAPQTVRPPAAQCC